MERPRHFHVSCRDMKHHMLDELDTKLASPQFRKYKVHLEQCSRCRAYLSGLRSVIWLYRHYPIPPLSTRMRNHVLEAVFAHNERRIHKPHAAWNQRTAR